MSTLKVAQLVRETGCQEIEAENALVIHHDIERARESIKTELEYRHRKYGPKLGAIWQRYSATDVTDFDGAIKLLEDLNLDPSDETALALVYELGSQQVGVFDKKRYIEGWARLKCSTLSEMQAVIPKLAQEMHNSSYFGRVYKNAFKFNLEPGHRLLDIDTAISYWELLLAPRFSQVDKWIEFTRLQNHKVSADTWNMYLEFCEYTKTDPDLKAWDENGAWPIVIDDFVEYCRA